MEDYKVLNMVMYNESKGGISLYSGDKVNIIGEQKVQFNDDHVCDQYLYNIVGYKASNGKPFVALKSNIALL